ncbi:MULTISPECIES: hypothetical protein [Kamptonema]|uniref:hypothetical protein n=1 Tax=Kamptonema TaxID=1501433 RepID=UPI0001DAD02C|nr:MULTISPECIES: hypothetical protein [Kamptonema]CBN55763.1 conserved exported hypothetical protein [Kamptonema sp. PCC 6506]
MFTSNQWHSRTVAILALGILVGAAAPNVAPAPATAQRISPYIDARIPAGTTIPVNYEKDKIIVTPDETAPLTLTVARDIRSSQGRVLIPAGSEIVGQLQPARRGSQFVAKELLLGRNKRYRINANSRVVTRTETVERGANTGSIVKGAAIGAAAAAAISGITGDKAIATEEVLGGAGIGAIAGVLFGRKKVDVVVIRPEQDLGLTVRSELVLR